MLKNIRSILLSPIFIGLLVLLSLIVRWHGLPLISLDMQKGLFDWYSFILKRGFVNAFKEDFALYTPAYLYLLWLATLVNGVVSQVTLIKSISMSFDILSAFFVYKIIRLKYPHSRVPWLAAALVFSLPTVILNSSYWGQCDSIYISFLLGCLYFLLTKRPVRAILFFSLAFAFKLQAVFLLPFLAVYTLRKKIPWWSYLLIPAVYILFALPTIYAGRPWLDVLSIYATQTDKFPKWSVTLPSMYLPLQGSVPLTKPLTLVTVALAAVIVLTWVYLAWKKHEEDGYNPIILAALASAALVPFVLPRMHERYFYLQDLTALIAAFFMPELWFLPILSQVISVMSYGPFLFNYAFGLQFFGQDIDTLLYLALPFEIILLSVTLWKQFRASKRVELFESQAENLS